MDDSVTHLVLVISRPWGCDRVTNQPLHQLTRTDPTDSSWFVYPSPQGGPSPRTVSYGSPVRNTRRFETILFDPFVSAWFYIDFQGGRGVVALPHRHTYRWHLAQPGALLLMWVSVRTSVNGSGWHQRPLVPFKHITPDHWGADRCVKRLQRKTQRLWGWWVYLPSTWEGWAVFLHVTFSLFGLSHFKE